MKVDTIQTSFAGGEFAPALYGRTDIAQDGASLQAIRSGYTAIFTIETAMQINISVGTVRLLSGETVASGQQIVTLAPGTYRVSESTGESGGFRVYP